MQVVILDYGIGNYSSVSNFFKRLVDDVIISNELCKIRGADVLVLPGVGGFGSVMNYLHSSKLDKAILDFAASEKIIIGICIGMHILGHKSTEAPNVPGLSLLDFEVKRRPKGCNIGWRDIYWKLKHDDEISVISNVYFNHSFVAHNAEKISVGYSNDEVIPSVVRLKNIIGFQFHPEKSQDAGEIIMKKYLHIDYLA